MHLCGLFVKSLHEKNPRNAFWNKVVYDEFLTHMRVLGLLHDLGHGPWSHNFDTAVLREFHMNSKLRRKVLGRRNLLGMNHEVLASKIVEASRNTKDSRLAMLGDALESFEPRLNLDRLAEDLKGVKRLNANDLRNGRTEVTLTPRESIVHSILRGAYSADRIDFLLRDSYYAGTREYGTVDWRRLIRTSKIGTPKEGGVGLLLEKRSVHTFFSFMVAYYTMFSAVYYHRTCRMVNMLTESFLKSFFIDDQKGKDPAKKKLIADILTKPQAYLDLDECSVISLAAIHGSKKTKSLAKRILERRLPYKCLAAKYWKPLERAEEMATAEELLDGESSLIRKRMDKYLKEHGVKAPWYHIDHQAARNLPKATPAGIRDSVMVIEGGVPEDAHSAYPPLQVFLRPTFLIRVYVEDICGENARKAVEAAFRDALGKRTAVDSIAPDHTSM
jgi:HD superfamily phosphohydrolase